MSIFNNRVRALSKKKQLELIRVWDYVDSAEHCIDTFTNKVEVHKTDFIEESNNLSSCENYLEYVYE